MVSGRWRHFAYPWAWFWFMFHGNRIGDGVGRAIAEAVRDAQIGVPEAQREALLDWLEEPYGF